MIPYIKQIRFLFKGLKFNLFMYIRWSLVLNLTGYLACEVHSHLLRTAQSARPSERISAPQFQELLRRFGHSGSKA